MNDKIEKNQICRGCMKVGGLFLSMFNDSVCDKKLPDKLAHLASTTVDKHDGLPDVLCAKCAYRTDAYYNFRLQVQESEKKLRQMFNIYVDNLSTNTSHSKLNDEKFINTDPESKYCEMTDSPNNSIENNLSGVLIDINYSSDTVKESLDDKIAIEQFCESNTDIINQNNDQFLIPSSSEFCISKTESINVVEEKISNDFNDVIDPSTMQYMLLYVSPTENSEINTKMHEIDEQSLNTNENHSEINIIKEEEITIPDNDEIIDMIDDKNQLSDGESEDYLTPKENVLGTLNDTIVRVKEIKLDNGKLQHQCTLCMQNYSELTKALIHTVENHIPISGPFYCVVCEKDCSTHRELRNHVKTHTGPSPYKCFICDKSYSMKRYLKRHMICHPDFKRHRCSKCGRRFNLKKDLDDHILHLHYGAPYSCSQCSRLFNHKSNYKRHLISHLDPLGISLPKYPCSICGKRFVNNRTMQTHMRVHTGEKPFRCNVCNRSFSQQGNLISHARIHTNPRSYTCEVCGKRFNQRATLRDHALLHTGEKPYVCNICGVAFTFSTALRRHMWSHSDNKPFGCDVCNARFIGRYDLNRHMRIHNNHPKTTRRKNQSQLNNNDDDDDNIDDVNIPIESSNQEQEQDNIVVTQVSPVAEQTIFIEHVLGDQDGIQIIVPQEDSEKENVDALFNLIQYED
ncbi:hypothetical protein PV325_013529 [Microctonus aethiopoides]|uniref:Uncharacterized protein n=1 Tax=Microctonus aethiopoides TaxID=144406 RepID=A0AA39FIL9_9HYME|nr:hypothetical protein PV326_006737 [Microctonus aethiopoides]KAK0087980.1 hypothetical protein PV325_013529 [Microctonus aethiopoides]KAK0170223.1 hypothetical protein PV328_010808 [Microctonus aethiopoides]